MCACILYILMGMPLLHFGLWPFERLLRLDWHGQGVGKDCLLGTGSCQGMMGNKDIIECKLPKREHEGERL